jgi:hypothetical protein
MILFLKLAFIMAQVLGLAAELHSLVSLEHWQTQYSMMAVFGFRWVAMSGLILLVCNHDFSNWPRNHP